MASMDHELQQAKAEVERLRQHIQALYERTHYVESWGKDSAHGRTS